MTIPERNRLPHPESATAWFGDRFGVPLPRGLRERAEAMSWDAFVATYGRSGGPLRLGPWERTDSDCAATGLGSRAGNYRAVIAVGDQIGTATAAAAGPIAALTAMLHERGINLEILNFHQMRSATATATFIRGGNGARV
ncbi:homocitrate synthase, partial [Mycobacterium avium]|uniref:homocitrate synthase n=2 Tax=Mycobacterium avium TaxID=1764 RepID=UPI00111C8132